MRKGQINNKIKPNQMHEEYILAYCMRGKNMIFGEVYQIRKIFLFMDLQALGSGSYLYRIGSDCFLSANMINKNNLF
jgi:hypothetical protein